MTGLRAELAISETDACPVAAVSEETPVRDVEWTGGDRVVERFAVSETVPERVDPTDGADTSSAESTPEDGVTSGVEMDPVYADEESAVVEFDRDWDGCVCELIEATGCPVESVKARDGELTVTVHARSRERLKAVIEAARGAAGRVSLNYVVTGDSREAADPVVVDRGRLTDRQREVLETAYELGYFAHPRETNAERVAAELGVAPATFREHLAAAQSKLLGTVVE